MASLGLTHSQVWKKSEAIVPVKWFDKGASAGMPVRISVTEDGCEVLSSDFEPLGEADVNLPKSLQGILQGMVSDDEKMIGFSYVGPEEPLQIEHD